MAGTSNGELPLSLQTPGLQAIWAEILALNTDEFKNLAENRSSQECINESSAPRTVHEDAPSACINVSSPLTSIHENTLPLASMSEIVSRVDDKRSTGLLEVYTTSTRAGTSRRKRNIVPRDRRVGGVKQKVVTTTAQVHVDATSDEISVIPNTPEPKRPRKSQGQTDPNVVSSQDDVEKWNDDMVNVWNASEFSNEIPVHAATTVQDSDSDTLPSNQEAYKNKQNTKPAPVVDQSNTYAKVATNDILKYKELLLQLSNGLNNIASQQQRDKRTIELFIATATKDLKQLKIDAKEHAALVRRCMANHQKIMYNQQKIMNDQQILMNDNKLTVQLLTLLVNTLKQQSR
ncbi:uncharacterized protein [Danio rerio]|uniref:Uncharacterized protein n=1 Tax=Danio rerio TaxID=7955 RepID=A0AC58IYK3_DANRE